MKSSLLRFMHDNRRYAGGILAAVGIAFFGGLVQVGIASLAGKLVDYGVTNKQGSLSVLMIELGVLMLAELLRSLSFSGINAITSECMFKKLRLRIWNVMAHADASILENNYSSGDTISRVNNDMSELCEQIAGRIPWLMRVVITGLIALVYAFYLSWQLSIIYMILVPLSIYWMKQISKPIQKLTKSRSAHIGKAMNVASDALHGSMAVKVFQLEEIMEDRFALESDSAAEEAIRNEKIAIRLSAAKMLFSSLPICSLLLLGLKLISLDILTVGTIIAFVTISKNIDAALRQLDSIVSTIRKAEAMAERIYELCDIPLEQDPYGKLPAAITSSDPIIKFQNVSFAYPNKPVLFENLNFSINKGQKVGFVGASGCGKSSIIKMICSFYKPLKGTIQLFGKDYSKWNHDELREHLSIVTQDAYLFDGTISENVSGSAVASEEKIKQSLREASLEEFVDGLSEGINTRVNELGTRFSGGQRQRLAIARALHKNAPIILLDEPTSALDKHTEEALQKTLTTLMRDKTAIVISHQYSMLKNLDWIYFIEDGQIAEQGKPTTLWEEKGRFYQMMKEQIDEEGRE